MQNLHEKLSDSELYKLAQDYGLRAKQWLRKFEGLLPEIARRKLYKRRGCSSIHEFAAKLAGMSHEKTNRILMLAATLQNKPHLKVLLETGAASYSKLKTVAYIATPKTDVLWAEKVVAMPKAALEIFVASLREKTAAQKIRLETVPGDNLQPEKMALDFSDNFSAGSSAVGTRAANAVATFNTLSIKISPELEFELRLLKQKLEKARGETLGFAEVLQELLKVYKASGETVSTGRAAKSRKIIALCPNCIKEKENEKALWGVTQRPIPMAVQNLVTARQNEKCAFPNCENPPEIFHHTRRFSLNQNHDPDFIVHLCVPHERLLHAGLIENEEKNPSEWRLKCNAAAETAAPRVMAQTAKSKYKIDEKVNVLRREPNLIGV